MPKDIRFFLFLSQPNLDKILCAGKIFTLFYASSSCLPDLTGFCAPKSPISLISRASSVIGGVDHIPGLLEAAIP